MQEALALTRSIRQLSKISWLDDVLVYRPSIIPIVIRPVLFITLFAAGVALASVVYGKEVALTNNVGG
jgi:putative membrane protein